MKKRFFFTGLGLAFLAALFLMMTTPATKAEAQTFNFTYSTFFPPTHIQTKVPQAWAAEIEKRSKGKIKIKIFTGGSLTPAPQIYDGVVKGISDFGLTPKAKSKGEPKDQK